MSYRYEQGCRSWCSSIPTNKDVPLPEYPRPRIWREGYIILNGWWEYTIQIGGRCEGIAVEDYPMPKEFEGRILVPFSPESELSDVKRTLMPDDVLWYRRRFRFTKFSSEERMIINFEAVDWECACWVNGVFVGVHIGGYEPFSLDVTEALRQDGLDDEIALCVLDPTDSGAQPRGKQRLDARGIWYPAQSGIWQTVWAEIVPKDYVVAMEVSGDAVRDVIAVRVATSCADGSLSAEVRFDDELVACYAGRIEGGSALVHIPIDSPRLWSPECPNLYRVHVNFERDNLDGYCAFRTIELRNDGAGTMRLFLNGEPLVLRGVLVQGYWPDGLMTPHADDALVRDIVAAKEHGFNAIRMHAKVECRRFYYHCDVLGMLVLQDLVPGGERIRMRLAGWLPLRYPAVRHLIDDRNPVVQRLLGVGSKDDKEEWLREAMAQMRTLRSHPCVIAWTIFNEGWGQYSARRVTRLLREVDSTRPIDATSGWFDQRVGDFLSVHDYSEGLRALDTALEGKRCGFCKHDRAVLLSEFGGLSYTVPGHYPSNAAWGYVRYKSRDEYTKAFRSLIDAVECCAERGLVGYVYTQLYDVQQECNGILTYDREVKKFEGF